MNELREQAGHDEIKELLPWYVNGTLDNAELRKVEAHLGDCYDCRKDVEVLDRIQAAATDEAPSPIVPRPRVNELFDRIDAQGTAGPRFFRTPSIAAAAAIAVIAASVVFFASIRDEAPLPRGEFETLTSGAPAVAMDFIFAVQFEAELSDAERQQVYERIGGTEIGLGEGPEWYRMAVQLDSVSFDDIGRFTTTLESMKEVRAVRVVAIPSPVR